MGRNNALQCRRGDLQCVVLAVDVDPHRERGIGVPEPRRDDRDRHALRVHEAGARVPRVVQADASHFGVAAQIPPEVTERVWVVWPPRFVDDDVL